MTPLFKKLNFKSHPHIFCINPPASFQTELVAMQAFTTICTTTEPATIEFAMAFGTTLAEVEKFTHQIAPKLAEDGIYWFCYPKKSSKNYTCEFNRDTGWAVMGKYDLEGVRQVAIDADWSALRFRNVHQIKKITRSKKMALTQAAKERTTGK